MAGKGHTKIDVTVIKAAIELPGYCHLLQIDSKDIAVTWRHNAMRVIGRSYEYCFGTNTLKVAVVGTQLKEAEIYFGIAGPVHKCHTEIVDGKEVTVIDEMTLHSVSVIDGPIDGIKHKLI